MIDTEERLTNVRFADDLIVYATSLKELLEMLDFLAHELLRYGLELNATKTKIFTTDRELFDNDIPTYVDADSGFIDVLRATETHKYLGAVYPGDLSNRGKVTLEHRLRCAWSKFHSVRETLTNRHVDVRLRLKLFDAVVTPAALYGLTASPLAQKQCSRLGVTQRKMLRLIIGYTKHPEDTWADMYRRLRQRILAATSQHPIREWEEELSRQTRKFHDQLITRQRNRLSVRVFFWDPQSTRDPKFSIQPRRKRGRPCTKWYAKGCA